MKLIRYLMIGFLCFFLFACPSPLSNTPAKVAPTIVSFDPADSATNIATNSSITITFSAKMDSSTITPSSFTLAQAGVSVAGTVSYDDATKTATFKPNVLLGNLPYSVAITAAVKDAAGVALTSPKTWIFTTGVAPDTTPPTVVSTFPANGITNTPVEQPITATFSESIDASTITSVSFTISGVTGTVSYDAPSETATFLPAGRLLASTLYTAMIAATIKDLAGNSMSASKVWTFTTTDEPAPIVSVNIDPATIASLVPTSTYSQAQPPAIVTGKGGNGVDFAGDDQFLMIPDAPANRLTSSGGSVECWIYPTTNMAGQGIVHKGVMNDFSDEAYSLQYWNVSGGNAQLAIILDKGPGDYLAVISDYIIPENAWSCIVATWNTATTYLYVNGALVASQPSNGYVPIQNSSGGVVIGKQLPDPSSGYYTAYGYKGTISDINLYDRTMGAQEVLDHYNATNH
jgi:hypothetical protein